MRSTRFEWDDAKASSNARKHGVGFSEAAEVFDDDRRLTAFDIAHSTDEDRWTAMGLSRRGRVLVVTYVRRDERIRIVSARRSVQWERAVYEQQAEEQTGGD